MWWLIPVGIGVGLKLLYDAVTEEEYAARQRWEETREEVEKSIEEHQQNIDLHIKQAKDSYDFHFLVDLHYSSMNVANSAYKLLGDAKSSFDGMSKMLKKSKDQRAFLQVELDTAKRSNDRKAIHETIEQLKMINELRKNIFSDRDKVKEQRNSFLEEVRRLNSQTKELKEFIRDRCGHGGQKWHNRLECRKQARLLDEQLAAAIQAFLD